MLVHSTKRSCHELHSSIDFGPGVPSFRSCIEAPRWWPAQKSLPRVAIAGRSAAPKEEWRYLAPDNGWTDASLVPVEFPDRPDMIPPTGLEPRNRVGSAVNHGIAGSRAARRAEHA